MAEPIVLTPDIHDTLDTLDRRFVGYARPTEHQHWTAQMGGKDGAARLFRRREAGTEGAAGEIVGYAYFGATASGPALARDPADLPAMLAHVAAIGRQTGVTGPLFDLEETIEPCLALAGTNTVMLRWLLDCGWRIVFQYLLMSSQPLGQWEHCVCHNPLYMP